jgi:glycosyltransferase involved in cell wall biosynthesis
LNTGQITILTGSHLCHNPRVIKEAATLAEAGYDVEVLGGWFDAVLKARDQELMAKIKFRFRPLHDLTEQPALRLWLRVRGRIAKEIHVRTGRENRWQLGYFVSALQKAVRQSKGDLFIAHSEQALWAVAQLQKQKVESRKQKSQGASQFQLSAFSFRNFRIGVDMEDWFSEDLPQEARKHRPVKLLRGLEQTVLCRGRYATCTSRAMSEALAKEYGCRPPTVIYNAFPWSDRANLDGQFKDRQNRNLPSVHWYSQTLGSDRGLGDLFAALPHLKQEAEIHLRGKPVAGFEDWLAAHVPENWRTRVFIHGLVSNDELLSRLAEHDIGFAGEQKFCRSRDLTVTNKILHYLLGGLAVAASDTAGHREVAGQAKEAVRIYPSGDGNALAARINELLDSREKLSSAKASALRAAENTFCWEQQVSVLLEGVRSRECAAQGPGRGAA